MNSKLQNLITSDTASFMVTNYHTFKYPPEITGSKVSLQFIDNFKYSSDFDMTNELNEDELTQMCMLISENSLNDDWKHEKEGHWESFLKETHEI